MFVSIGRTANCPEQRRQAQDATAPDTDCQDHRRHRTHRVPHGVRVVPDILLHPLHQSPEPLDPVDEPDGARTSSKRLYYLAIYKNMCMYVYILADVTNPDFRSRARLAIFPVQIEPDENEYLQVYLFTLFVNCK